MSDAEIIHRCLDTHTRPYEPRECDAWPRCGKPAKVEVWTGTNDLVGYFCTPHGNLRVAQYHRSGLRYQLEAKP